MRRFLYRRWINSSVRSQLGKRRNSFSWSKIRSKHLPLEKRPNESSCWRNESKVNVESMEKIFFFNQTKSLRGETLVKATPFETGQLIFDDHHFILQNFGKRRQRSARAMICTKEFFRLSKLIRQMNDFLQILLQRHLNERKEMNEVSPSNRRTGATSQRRTKSATSTRLFSPIA